MKYCTQCGHPLTEKDLFCGHCGARIKKDVQVPLTQVEKCTKQATSHTITSRQKKILIGATIGIVCILVIILLCSGESAKRADFNVKLTSEGMAAFMEVVCRNVDGEAEVVDPHVGGDAWGPTYWTEVSIKLPGKVVESAEIRFYNSEESDTASVANIVIYDPQTENEFYCKKELILAFERTVAGTTVADQYLTTYNEVYHQAYEQDAGESQVIASYWLTKNLYVTMKVRNSGHMSWTADYYLYTREAALESFGMSILQ